jgi:hypothetical protein
MLQIYGISRKYLHNLTYRIRQFSAERTRVFAALFRKATQQMSAKPRIARSGQRLAIP